MATVHSIFKLRGGVGEAVFRQLETGTNVLNRRPQFDARRWRESSEYRNSRRAACDFSGASSTTKAFYQHLHRFDALLKPYTHNAILATILRAAQRGEPLADLPGRPGAITRFTAPVCAVALTGLDLGRAHPSKGRLAFMRPYGMPVHRTTTHKPLSGGIAVHGLREAAAEVSSDPRKELHCRLHVFYAPFTDHVYVSDNQHGPVPNTGDTHWQSTQWMPAAGLPAAIPLKLKTPGDMCTGGAAYVVFCIVEWMSLHGARRRYHREAACVKVLGVLHPDLDDSPPVIIRADRRYLGSRKKAKAPRVSPEVRARVAAAAFTHQFLKGRGGPEGRYAQKKTALAYARNAGIPLSAIYAIPSHPK